MTRDVAPPRDAGTLAQALEDAAQAVASKAMRPSFAGYLTEADRSTLVHYAREAAALLRQQAQQIAQVKARLAECHTDADDLRSDIEAELRSE